MRFKEFEPGKAWIDPEKVGPFTVKYYYPHFYDQIDTRGISKLNVKRIIRRIPYVKKQIDDMRHFSGFWLRDDETGTELGCRIVQDADGSFFLGVVTAVNKPEPRIKPEKPVIVVNAEHTRPHITKDRTAEPILTEGATDILYHYTGVTGAMDILRNGEFGLSVMLGQEKKHMPKGYDFFLSTTRSRTGDYHRITGNIAAMFVLDGRAIGQRYKVVPVDYWEQTWLSTHHKDQGYRTRESEDRIVSNEPTMSIKYATEVHFLVKDLRGLALHGNEKAPAQIKFLIDQARQQGIPHWTYFSEQAWRLLDKRRALSPQDEQKYFQDELPPAKDYSGTQWEPTNYLARWEQLIELDPSQRRELRPKAQDLVRKLEWAPSYGEDLGLTSDLMNARKPYDGGRSSAVKIVKFMRKNNLDIPGLVQYLAKKWERQDVKEGIYDSITFKQERRKLNVPLLIQRGAIFVTHPHGEQGWEIDNPEPWAFSLITLYNLQQGGWTAEAKKYLKPASYNQAARQINSSAPNLGSDQLVYDGKYNQILWSIKKLGLEKQAFLNKNIP